MLNSECLAFVVCPTICFVNHQLWDCLKQHIPLHVHVHPFRYNLTLAELMGFWRMILIMLQSSFGTGTARQSGEKDQLKGTCLWRQKQPSVIGYHLDQAGTHELGWAGLQSYPRENSTFWEGLRKCSFNLVKYGCLVSWQGLSRSSINVRYITIPLNCAIFTESN